MSFPPPAVEIPDDLEDDWETADISLNIVINEPEFQAEAVDYKSSSVKKEEFSCTACEKKFGDKNSLNCHLRTCSIQEAAFSKEFKGRKSPKAIDLKNKMKKECPKDLDKLWEWINYVVNLPQVQEFGTGESFGLQDLHPRLSHFIIWAISQFVLGNNIFTTAPNSVETAMESFRKVGWENQAATNRLVPFLNDLVKKKKGRDIEPIPTLFAEETFIITPIEIKKSKSIEEIKLQREEDAIKLSLGREIMEKGFKYNLQSSRSIPFLRKYLVLTENILNQQKELDLEPIHVSKSRVDFENSLRTMRGVVHSQVMFKAPPYPEFHLNEDDLDRAIKAVNDITEFMLIFKNDTFKNGKDGLDVFYNKGITIEGFVLFPFNQLITKWLEDKRIPVKMMETFKVKCNRLKKGSSLLHAMKEMGQIDAIF